MAKAKKPASASPKKKTTPASAAGVPPIDTAQAAMAAAKFISAKTIVNPSAPPAKESAGFKNLRESLNKPATSGMTNFLNDSAGPAQKKSDLPSFGGKQVGRNQTFGADVNRAGVPRRTGGG